MLIIQKCVRQKIDKKFRYELATEAGNFMFFEKTFEVFPDKMSQEFLLYVHHNKLLQL
jgi:hypothetical protein